MPRPVSPGRRASRRAGTLGLCHRLDLRPLCLAGNGDGRPVGRDRRSSGDSVRVHPAETMAGRRMRSEAVGNLVYGAGVLQRLGARRNRTAVSMGDSVERPPHPRWTRPELRSIGWICCGPGVETLGRA